MTDYETLIQELRNAAGGDPYGLDADWTEELFARAADALQGLTTEKRVEIGKICEKSNGHLDWKGFDDYGVCGSHYFATIYASVIVHEPNRHHPNVSLDEISESLRQKIAFWDRERFNA